MNLNKTIIVNQGQNMIAEAVNSSLPLIMTQFKLGTGTVNNETEALALTDVVAFFRNQPIDSHTQNGNIYSATCKYNNEGILSDVTVTENGLYAKVGEGGIEKLFAYVTFEPGDFLPVAGVSVIAEYEKTLNFGITGMADVQIINSRFAEVAGKGLMENQTTGKIDVVSSNDGIIVNANNITVDTINNLTTASTTKPLSSNQGKILSESKADKTTQIIAGTGLTGGGDLTTDRTLNIVSANAGIIVNADNIELKPATTSIIGGVKPDGTTITVDAVGKITTAEKWKSKNNYIPTGLDANDIFENGEFQLTIASQTTPPSIQIGSQFFLTCRMTNEANSGYGIQCAYSYSNIQNADVIAYRTHTGGITKSWGPWRYLVDKVIADETYVKKAGDTMRGDLTATALAATNGFIFAKYNNLETDQVYLYNNSTDIGIYNDMPTHGGVYIFSRSKSTGVVTYAGGNYGTINGSTATFSGNVTAPSITIGGYVVTIV